MLWTPGEQAVVERPYSSASLHCLPLLCLCLPSQLTRTTWKALTSMVAAPFTALEPQHAFAASSLDPNTPASARWIAASPPSHSLLVGYTCPPHPHSLCRPSRSSVSRQASRWSYGGIIFDVHALAADHCQGAIMLLFQSAAFGTILHTGGAGPRLPATLP